MRQPFVFIGNAPSIRNQRDPGSAFNKMCHNNLISFTATKPRAFSFVSPAFFEKECMRMWFVFCLFFSDASGFVLLAGDRIGTHDVQ